MGKAYKGEVSKYKPKRAITYTGAVIRYYRTKKKILEKLNRGEINELENTLENEESLIKLSMKISALGTIAQITLGIYYLFFEPFINGIAPEVGIQFPKWSSGYKGRKSINKAYLVLEQYLK